MLTSQTACSIKHNYFRLAKGHDKIGIASLSLMWLSATSKKAKIDKCC